MKKPYSLGVYLTALVALVLVPLFGVAIYAGWQAWQHIQIHAADPHDAPMLAAAQQTMLNVLLWIGIVILLSLLAVRRFSRRHLTDNIKQLVAFTQRIANQDFAQSPEPTGGPAELCALTDSVQRMSANLQRALTDSHAAVAQLTKLNRIYAMLDAANKTILTGTLDREALCLESCRIAVTHGPFVLACIALNEPREGAPRFVAAGAPADDFLREWNFPSTEAVPAFIATVLREGCACVRNDLAREEHAAPWRDAALRLGYCSAAAFPMRTGNRNFGAYVLFSEQAGTFDSEEAKLLGHLATNLAHAIQFNEQEERRLYAEQVREKSENWFRTITENSSDLIVVIDPQGLIRFVSHSVSQLLGHKSNDLLERSAWDYIHPDDIATLQGALAENLPYRGVFGPYQYRVRHQNQSWIWFEAVANNLLTDEAVRGIVINARDITPRKLAEETIRYRLTFEQKIAVISSRFVGGEDFDAVLQAALADMGLFRKADRAYLFLLRDGDAVMDNTHEWCAPGVSAQKDNLQNIPTATFPWWMAKLHNREIIRIPNVALLPPEAAAERAILESQDIKSLLVLPVYIGDKLGGFIGFDNVHTTGEWGNEDNSLLQVAAELIGRAIAQHRAEEEAKANHARLLSVLEAHNHPIYVSDPVTYEVLYTNRTTQDLLGDIRSRKCYEYFHDRTAPCPFCTNDQLLRQDDDKPIQWEHYNEKIHRWYQCNDSSITWPDGRRVRYEMAIDITERKQAEQALRQSEEQFHGAFEHASIGMALVSPTGQFLKINPALCTIIGYTEAELLQRTFQDITHPDDLQADLAHVHQVLDGKLQTYEMEKRYFHKTGHVVWVQLSVSLVRTADGAPLHFVSQIQDITERKQAELQRTATLEILDTLNRLDDLPLAVRHILEIIQRTAGAEAAAIRLASEGDFHYYSQIGFNEQFIQAENNLCCRNPDGTIQLDANGQPLLECTCGLVLSGNTDPSNPLFTPAGSAWTNDSEKLLLIHPSADPRLHPRNRCIHEGYRSVALIPIHAGDTIVGLLQLNDHPADRFTPALITFLESLGASIGIALAQRHAQEQLRLSTERYQLVITGSASGIWDWDVANHRVHYSARWKALHGYTEHEINDSEEHWKKSIHHDDQPRVLAAVQNHFEGKTDVFEEEYRIRQKDGTYRWVLDRGKAIFNATGQPVRMAGSEIDITDRKQAEEELRKRYEQLLRWQRATVGRELRMVELKQEVNHLSRAAGLPEPYPPHNPAAAANSQSEES